jgi:4-hydroxy-tetrahydrodipicolinate synthase
MKPHPFQGQLKGTFTALVTPFVQSGAIDWPAFDKLLEGQVAGRVEGVVPCGTTGESPTLSHEEHIEVVKRTVKTVAKRTLVIAGCGSNSTREAIEMSRASEAAGADALMVVVPYYNKPTQEGLFQHFVAVARAVKLPIVIYNIPGRTGMDLISDTLARICEATPNVVATKEATGNVMRAQKLASMLGDRLTMLSGDDALTLPMITVGGSGVISVTSNLLPLEVSETTRLGLAGKLDEARRAHLRLFPVHEAMFVEANPGPVKALLAEAGAMLNTVRLPLVPVTEATRAQLVKTLEQFRAGAR